MNKNPEGKSKGKVGSAIAAGAIAAASTIGCAPEKFQREYGGEELKTMRTAREVSYNKSAFGQKPGYEGTGIVVSEKSGTETNEREKVENLKKEIKLKLKEINAPCEDLKIFKGGTYRSVGNINHNVRSQPTILAEITGNFDCGAETDFTLLAQISFRDQTNDTFHQELWGANSNGGWMCVSRSKTQNGNTETDTHFQQIENDS